MSRIQAIVPLGSGEGMTKEELLPSIAEMASISGKVLYLFPDPDNPEGVLVVDLWRKLPVGFSGFLVRPNGSYEGVTKSVAGDVAPCP